MSVVQDLYRVGPTRETCPRSLHHADHRVLQHERDHTDQETIFSERAKS